MTSIAKTPKPPYYAVIFTSIRTGEDKGYGETAARLLDLAATMDGFLGVESARGEGVGITVSYWKSMQAIKKWREHPEHHEAIQRGYDTWYEHFTTRVCKVERESGKAG